MSEFWNERYASEKYVYGEEPNIFFKQEIDKLNSGKLLLPGEGEGRNAVYAAKKGWKILAYDQSKTACEKALQLAKKNDTTIEYIVTTTENFVTDIQFNAIGLIYVHYPSFIRKLYHDRLIRMLDDNGVVILEAFNKEQINQQSGGPPDVDMLYSKKEMESDFKELNIIYLEEKTIEFSEGHAHEGLANVIRMVAKK